MNIIKVDYKLADGLGVKQDFPRDKVLAIRKKYAKFIPVSIVGGFPMWNYNHIDSLGRLKRDSVNQIEQSRYEKAKHRRLIQLRPKNNDQVQQQSLQQQLWDELAKRQPQPKPNYSGQYAQPVQHVQPKTIDLNNYTANQSSQPTQTQQAQAKIQRIQHKIDVAHQQMKQIKRQNKIMEARQNGMGR